MKLSGAILLEIPEEAIIDAIWRCKRGHEQPAAWHMPNGQVVPQFAEFSFVKDGEPMMAVCLRCILDDYQLTRVDFGSEDL